MKKNGLILIIWISFQTNFMQDALNQIWIEMEKAYQLADLKLSNVLLVNASESLTPNQWTFRDDPAKWPIGQVLEHRPYWEMVYSQDNPATATNDLGSQYEKVVHTFSDVVYSDYTMDAQPLLLPEIAESSGLLKSADVPLHYKASAHHNNYLQHLH